ncbi:MAG: hypothetical protein HYY20_00730 [Candidatus Tectomicrobia bacterium]|uniref:Nucleotidyltransferase domain-containing protein n=1 Tax=Tectimicrobiota bacterium TaxID=2528274 RepID=A0A932CLI4_UNCTE|nr:hypothetical protein [Candidatus Tectomicrobia bacterium]
MGEVDRMDALASAKACIQVLKERFHARRVVLFGSLVGQGPWHSQSELRPGEMS